MDDRGNFYASTQMERDRLAAMLGEKVGDTTNMPKSAIPVDDDIVASLAELNHRCRRIFHSEVRRGVDKWVALERAHKSLPAGAP